MSLEPYVEDITNDTISYVGETLDKQLDTLDNNQLNIKFNNSSKFVLGKQTNFNGPVTIVNCPPALEKDEFKYVLNENNHEHPHGRLEDTVVIKDTVLSNSTAGVLKNELYQKNLNQDSGSCTREKYIPPKPEFGTVTCLPFLFSTRLFNIPIAGWILILGVGVGIMVSILVMLLQTKDTLPDDVKEMNNNTSMTGCDKEFAGCHKLYSKKEWGALEESSYVNISHPVPYVVISHTAGRMCYEVNTCMSVLRNIQKDLMSREPAFADIAYSFSVGGDGNIYEGRGWYHRTPLENFVNNRNIDINFIGDFSVYDNPTDTQFEAVQELIGYGIKLNMIDPNYILLAHNASNNGATLSPGKNVYKVIKTWPNFEEEPMKHIQPRSSL